MNYIYSILFSATLLLLSPTVICQNWNITYEASINFDTLERIDKSDKSQADLEKLKNDAENIVSTLLINQDYSSFTDNPILNNENRRKLNLVKILKGGNYYKKIKTNETFQVPRSTPEILIKVEPFTWKITTEKKIILGYPVVKAINSSSINTSSGIKKRLTTAWFAPSIPISSGPKDYNSLPGLVLETESSGGLVFRAIKISTSTNLKIEIPDYPVISNEEFVSQLKKMRESFRN